MPTLTTKELPTSATKKLGKKIPQKPGNGGITERSIKRVDSGFRRRPVAGSLPGIVLAKRDASYIISVDVGQQIKSVDVPAAATLQSLERADIVQLSLLQDKARAVLQVSRPDEPNSFPEGFRLEIEPLLRNDKLDPIQRQLLWTLLGVPRRRSRSLDEKVMQLRLVEKTELESDTRSSTARRDSGQIVQPKVGGAKSEGLISPPALQTRDKLLEESRSEKADGIIRERGERRGYVESVEQDIYRVALYTPSGWRHYRFPKNFSEVPLQAGDSVRNIIVRGSSGEASKLEKILRAPVDYDTERASFDKLLEQDMKDQGWAKDGQD